MMSRLRSSARSTGKRIISTWRDALRSGSAVADDVTTNKKVHILKTHSFYIALAYAIVSLFMYAFSVRDTDTERQASDAAAL